VTVSALARWVPLAAVVALLGAAMLAANFANPSIDAVPEQLKPLLSQSAEPVAPPSEQPTVPPRTPRAFEAPVARWVTWAVSIGCAVLVVIVLAVLLWLFLRDRARRNEATLALAEVPVPTLAETQAAVRAAVAAGLAALDDDGDPRRAVIACWVRLEAAAAAAGTPRAPGDTSTDLVFRLLGRHLVSEPVLATFADAYRAARFASHDVDVASRDQARAALRQLGDELAGARRG
jgi:Domain of unknown function (DUF4129)